jgi:hypothetical protein
MTEENKKTDNQKTEENKKAIPEEFTKVIRDFANDLKITFPEYEPFIAKWWKNKDHYNNIENEEERAQVYERSQQKSVKLIFDFCKKKFPPRFFDILYKNEDMFKEDSDVDTEFLPKIHFRNLWQCEISDKTRETIWKYLQLIMFSIVGTLDNKDAFGDTAKMFEAINQDEFKSKLEETLSQMQGLFDMSGNAQEEGSTPGLNMPDPQKIQEHIAGMLDGKLGQLAREIAEETAANLNVDFDDATDMKDVFQKLIKNPTKLMGLVKSVGTKLDTKIKSGDLKESELIAEATEMMNKMKSMPGMDNIQSMLSKMGLGGMGSMGGKLNMGAMEANLNQKMKMAKTKERMMAKAQARANAKVAEQEQEAQAQQNQKPQMSEEEIQKFLATLEEKPERTPRSTFGKGGAKSGTNAQANPKKKDKKK